MQQTLFAGAISCAVLFSATVAGDKPVVELHFDSNAESSERASIEHVQFRTESAGRLLNAPEHANAGSARFDGATSIVHTHLPGNAEALQHGSTWEGFFLIRPSSKIGADPAIGDRLITQFVDEEGSQTRLAIGLSAIVPNGPAFLCITFADNPVRRLGRAAVTPDVWHHFALVNDDEHGPAKLAWYLDYDLAGELILDGAGNPARLKPPGPAPLAIGAQKRRGNRVERGFDGIIDEIRISRLALAPSEFIRVAARPVTRDVAVELYEDLSPDFDWRFASLEPTESIPHEALAFVGLPKRFSTGGHEFARIGNQALHARCRVSIPTGRYQVLMRTEPEAVLRVDGRMLVDGRTLLTNHPLEALPAGQRDFVATFESDGRAHTFELSALYGSGAGSDRGEVIVGISNAGSKKWRLLGTPSAERLTPESWFGFRARTWQYVDSIASSRREAAIERGKRYWERRHRLARESAASWQVRAPADPNHPIDAFLARSFTVAGIQPAEIVDDATFIRRLSLDLRGRIPTLDELTAFLNESNAEKRDLVVEAMLESDEFADGWVGYWQDVLAENPSILKPTLNNSGPFRRWIYESIRDNVPVDRFATELIMMEGLAAEGGTAGFSVATNNDSPMAMKAHVLMKAFLAADMQCARCHDAPNAPFRQRDLFSIASMLNRDPLRVPAESVVPVRPNGRQPAVTRSLSAGDVVPPAWTIGDQLRGTFVAAERLASADPRAALAALVTSAEDPRFSDVFANRVWQRYMGIGLVEPVDNWNDTTEASAPELLRFLGGQLVASGYDLKSLVRLIVTSHAYQRIVKDAFDGDSIPTLGRFASQTRRRLSAEQIVDSLHVAAGKDFNAEELTFDPNRSRGFLNLGTPHRGWQLTSLSNERDRPALAMPVNQSIVDLLTTFGWRETRPDPLTVRDQSPTPLQPLILANGLMTARVVRLTEESRMTELCLTAVTVDDLADNLFLSMLSRVPDAVEREAVVALLGPAFGDRLTGKPKPENVLQRRATVNWDRHEESAASLALLEAERLARDGEPPTIRLTADFRERAEDVLWSLVNTPEFIFVP